MTTNRFPLFRLPFLALCKLLSFYGPQEIIPLSLCSKRSLTRDVTLENVWEFSINLQAENSQTFSKVTSLVRVAKKCWKKKEEITAELCAKKIPTVSLYFHETAFSYRFVIFEANDLKDQEWVGDAVLPDSSIDTRTFTFWEDKLFGIEQIVSYIKDLFDVPITKIEFDSEEYEDEFIDTMDCIMSQQESVQDCILRAGNSIDDCLTHLLECCEITRDLLIFGDLSDQFKNDWNIQLDSIYISYGSSLTFQNLTNIDCQSLELRHSSLTSEDANQFLKHWQNGGSPRVRYVSIGINSMNHDIVKSGIEGVPQPDTLHKTYLFMRSHLLTRSGGLDIQRNDGTTGTVYMFENKFDFGVDPIRVFRN